MTVEASANKAPEVAELVTTRGSYLLLRGSHRTPKIMYYDEVRLPTDLTKDSVTDWFVAHHGMNPKAIGYCNASKTTGQITINEKLVNFSTEFHDVDRFFFDGEQLTIDDITSRFPARQIPDDLQGSGVSFILARDGALYPSVESDQILPVPQESA